MNNSENSIFEDSHSYNYIINIYVCLNIKNIIYIVYIIIM